MTAVIRAFNLALAGNVDELRSMLTSGAVTAADKRADSSMFNGWTLLHAAASKNHIELVTLLLDGGAQTEAVNAQNRTAFDVAKAKGHDKICELLSARSKPAPTAPSVAPPPAGGAPVDVSEPQRSQPRVLDGDALEAAFDAYLDTLPEAEADKLTDSIAGKEGSALIDAMRRIIDAGGKRLPTPPPHQQKQEQPKQEQPKQQQQQQHGGPAAKAPTKEPTKLAAKHAAAVGGEADVAAPPMTLEDMMRANSSTAQKPASAKQKPPPKEPTTPPAKHVTKPPDEAAAPPMTLEDMMRAANASAAPPNHKPPGSQKASGGKGAAGKGVAPPLNGAPAEAATLSDLMRAPSEGAPRPNPPRGGASVPAQHAAAPGKGGGRGQGRGDGGRDGGGKGRGRGETPRVPPSTSSAANPAAAAAAAAALAARTSALVAAAKSAAPPLRAPSSAAPVGTLEGMCSEAEAAEREECNELSFLEVSAPPPAGQQQQQQQQRRARVDYARAVKKYQRPAAGAPPPDASTLRPLGALHATVEYLLSVWVERRDVAPLQRYVFISDRLRAVQQDLTVQRLRATPLLARVVRFHALMEAEFGSLADAAKLGFSAYQNRSLLCNALISALHGGELDEGAAADEGGGGGGGGGGLAECDADEALYAELLSYFVLIHADEPQEMLTELRRAPHHVARHARVARALRVAAAVARGDAVGVFQALDECTLLEVGCAVRLLPGIREGVVQQCNAAYNAREAVPLAALRRRLRLGESAEVGRCMASHGLPPQTDGGGGAAAAADGTATVRFHTEGFAARPAKAIEPPLALPDVPAIVRWRDASAGPVGGVAPKPPDEAPVRILGEMERQSRKAKRKPPPKGFLADADDDGSGAPAVAEESSATPPAKASRPPTKPAVAAACRPLDVLQMLRDGTE